MDMSYPSCSPVRVNPLHSRPLLEHSLVVWLLDPQASHLDTKGVWLNMWLDTRVGGFH